MAKIIYKPSGEILNAPEWDDLYQMYFSYSETQGRNIYMNSSEFEFVEIVASDNINNNQNDNSWHYIKNNDMPEDYDGAYHTIENILLYVKDRYEDFKYLVVQRYCNSSCDYSWKSIDYDLDSVKIIAWQFIQPPTTN